MATELIIKHVSLFVLVLGWMKLLCVFAESPWRQIKFFYCELKSMSLYGNSFAQSKDFKHNLLPWKQTNKKIQ